MIANSSVYHPVPVMIQPKDSCCWFTSFQMVVKYQRGRNAGANLKSPEQVDWVNKIYESNKGIGATKTEREEVARALGFGVLFASLNSDGLWECLGDAPMIYGGHWAGQGSGHFVVITGISEDTISINNPLTGAETYDYGWFASKFLIQTAERPWIYPL